MAVRVTQDVAEILAAPDGAAATAQAAVEVLAAPEGRARFAQSVAEVLARPSTASGRLGQVVVEILVPVS